MVTSEAPQTTAPAPTASSATPSSETVLPSGGDDLLVFFNTYRIIVNLVTVPSLEGWQQRAAELGLVVSFQADRDLLSHRGPLEVVVAFEPSAPIEGASQLHARGPMKAALSFELKSAPPFDWNAAKDIYDPPAIAVLERTPYQARLGGPREPDLIPTLLAVALAAAGEGVVYHTGLDAWAHGTDARAMWTELRRENEAL